MLGCFAARAVPVNVNYRYTPAELVPLLGGAGARALVDHASFAPFRANPGARVLNAERAGLQPCHRRVRHAAV
jgi:acyl-CoA synthetase (AMP-forming)/AMP-acid ligase II